MSEKFTVGDSVVVNPGTIDPDTGLDIGGWQGRVISFHTHNGEEVVTVHWDSITLEKIPLAVIEQCEENAMDWAGIVLRSAEVQITEARDTQLQAMEAEEQLRAQSFWRSSGPEGRYIHQVLKDIGPDDNWAAFRVWYGHLSANLKLPFAAQVGECHGDEALPAGDKVTVLDFNKRIEDRYGVTVDVNTRQGLLTIPLCALAALDEQSDNYDLLEEYRTWFANR